jgi:hypothetical protein
MDILPLEEKKVLFINPSALAFMHYTASVHFAVRLITNFSVLGGIWNFDP